ncbi:Glycosyl transferase 4-like domain-containing protein [Nitrosospira briensis]|uniref:Glycosyl transferase 4-like domain-containing protein n=2 Tax=Nitrosospira briensis TaxID=35799 RepID=A0A1I5BN99_9PROT|nr:Glycosyl transferase 4-like domain-containing protein [Nitrosospira briensis]
MGVSFRLLYLTVETWPTFRADVAVLFGKYLPHHGIHSDIVTGETPASEGAVPWEAGAAFLCKVSGGNVKMRLTMFLHGLRHLFGATPDRYDAIQVRDMPVLGVFGLLTARLKRLPFFYWMSYPVPEGQIALARERGLSAGLIKFAVPWTCGRVGRFVLYRIVLPRANHVFVQSERMKQDMVARGIAAARMTPVPMGIHLEDCLPAEIVPASNSRLAGRRVLVYLGTLERPRRIERLFEMLALVKRQVPQALLVLAGDTVDDVHRAWLKGQAQNAGVADDVLWTGWLPTREAWRYVKAAEIGLSPFPSGFLLDSASPTKVPEYLAFGLPVVCNNNPDQAAVISASGAGRCVPYTADDFADAVCELLELDGQSRSNMRASGQRYVAENRDYRLLANMVARQYESIFLK